MTAIALPSNERWKLHPAQIAGVAEIIAYLTSNFATSVISASNFTYDGSNRLTGFTADGVVYLIDYPDSTHINVSIGGHIKQITLNGAGQVIGIATL